MYDLTEDAKVLVDGSWGIHVPCMFVARYDPVQWGVSDDDQAVLMDPDHAHYWEVWDHVLNSARYVDAGGRVWRLYQDGDLWAEPCDAKEAD